MKCIKFLIKQKRGLKSLNFRQTELDSVSHHADYKRDEIPE